MKTLKSALVIALATLAVAGCTRKPVRPVFDLAATDTLLRSTGGTCEVTYRYARIANAAASPALQAIEEANIGYFYQLEGFTGSAEEAAEAAFKEIAADYVQDLPREGSVGADYEISAEAEGAVVDTLVTYTISRSSFTGGAHGMYGIECHTYSLAEGYELRAADLFGEERLPQLAELIRAKLYEQYEAANDAELTDKGFFPDYIGVTDNFCVTDEGVTFIYNPYEIGCYALGLVEVAVSREELEHL